MRFLKKRTDTSTMGGGRRGGGGVKIIILHRNGDIRDIENNRLLSHMYRLFPRFVCLLVGWLLNVPATSELFPRIVQKDD